MCACVKTLCAELCAKSCAHKASMPKSMHNTRVLCAARCTTLINLVHKAFCAGTSKRCCAEVYLVEFFGNKQ